jgi:hypothetical protein
MPMIIQGDQDVENGINGAVAKLPEKLAMVLTQNAKKPAKS